MRGMKAFCTIFFMLSFVSGTVVHAENDRTAKLTEKHGDVYKRGFVDWNRDEWGDPAPAHLGEHLAEGMQLGTGNKSWAQLTWKNVSARAWENSVYAIAPNQRLVYLMGGEMLFQLDKKRKDKTAAYYVWTKLLQARMRGTTALVQADKDVARVTVLEGTIDVLNRVDHSLVRLKPGVVYEIRSRDVSLPAAVPPLATALSGVSSTTAASGGKNDSTARSINSITVPGQLAVPLFDSGSTITSLLPLNPVTALAHPLLQGFTSPLASLGLISSALSALPAGLSNTVNSLTGIVTPLTSSVTGPLDGALSPVTSVATDTLGGVVSPLASTIAETATSAVSPLTSAVVDTATGAVSQLATPITSTANGTIAPLVSDIGSATRNAAGISSELSSAAGSAASISTLLPDGAGKTVNNGSPLTAGVSKGEVSKPAMPAALSAIVENVQVLQAPKKLPYKVGPLAGTHFAWPSNVGEFPPIGRVVVTADGSVVTLPGPVTANPNQPGSVSALNIGAGAFNPGNIAPGGFSNIGATAAGMSANITGSIGAAAGSISAIAGGATGALGATIGNVTGGAGSIVGGVTGTVGGILPGGGGGGLGGILPGGGGSGLGGLLPGGGGTGGGGGLGGLLPGGGGGSGGGGGLGGLLPGGGGGGLGF